MGMKTYDWYHDNLVSKEVVVQRWEIISTAAEKLHLRFHFYHKRIAILDSGNRFLDALLQLRGLTGEVLGYGLSGIDGYQGSDKVHRRVRRQRLCGGRGKKPQVDLLKRHDELQ